LNLDTGHKQKAGQAAPLPNAYLCGSSYNLEKQSQFHSYCVLRDAYCEYEFAKQTQLTDLRPKLFMVQDCSKFYKNYQKCTNIYKNAQKPSKSFKGLCKST